MTHATHFSLALAAVFAMAAPAWSEENAADVEKKAQQTSGDERPGGAFGAGDLEQKAQQTLESARETADEVAQAVDKDQRAQEASAGILKPIYRLAEAFSFPAFHGIAFAVMVAGVVSFALQLTLGKLVVLAKLGFSPAEILSDVLGLVVSLVGLVLTTQAATENSSFTKSSAAVLLATAVGAIAGFVFYLWGQRLELQALETRKRTSAPRGGEPKQ